MVLIWLGGNVHAHQKLLKEGKEDLLFGEATELLDDGTAGKDLHFGKKGEDLTGRGGTEVSKIEGFWHPPKCLLNPTRQ